MRPISHNEFRHQNKNETNLSPASMSSAFGGFGTPPESQATPDDLSPISPLFSPDIHLSNQNPFVHSSSFSAVYQTHAHASWQSLLHPMSQEKPESLVLQSRSGTHYAVGMLDHGATTSSQHMSIEFARGYPPVEETMRQITDLPGDYRPMCLNAGSC